MNNIPYKAFLRVIVRQSLPGFVAALIMLATMPAPALSRIIDGVAIIVNRNAVLVSEINAAMLPLAQEYRAKYAGDELKEKMAELRETIIKQAVETKLILQVAKTNGIVADDNEVDKRIDAVKRRFPSEAEFSLALEAKGLTPREYREQVVEQVLVQETIKRVLGSQIDVREDEIEQYYETHPDEFNTRPMVKLAQIFLKLPAGAAAEDIEETRQRAEQLRAQIEDGMDFGELAEKHSEGPYREKKGVIGVIGPEEILPELEKTAFGLESGEISPVVQTPYGFHILKALEARPARKIEFEEARSLIEERINEKKRSERYDEWMDALKEDSYIEIRI